MDDDGHDNPAGVRRDRLPGAARPTTTGVAGRSLVGHREQRRSRPGGDDSDAPTRQRRGCRAISQSRPTGSRVRRVLGGQRVRPGRRLPAAEVLSCARVVPVPHCQRKPPIVPSSTTVGITVKMRRPVVKRFRSRPGYSTENCTRYASFIVYRRRAASCRSLQRFPPSRLRLPEAFCTGSRAHS